MKTEILTINANMAHAFLARNKTNRPLSKSWVSALVNRINNNEWKLNGEAIKISKNGDLLDGQHRLTAIAQAKKAIQLLVISGIESDVFDTLDQGKKRGASDVFAIKGEKNYAVLASALRLVYCYQLNNDNPQISMSISPIELEKCLEKNPYIRNGFKYGEICKSICEKSVAVGCWYLFNMKDSALADIFFNRLADGANLTKNHPIKVLRDRLIQNKASVAKLPKIVVFAFFVKAWNACRLGKDLNLIRWREDELFPTII